MPKAPLEIRKAKMALEQQISDILFDAIMLWQKDNPAWMVTDADLGIIDISVKEEQRRMPATAVVELTKKDRTLKILKSGAVKEME